MRTRIRRTFHTLEFEGTWRIMERSWKRKSSDPPPPDSPRKNPRDLGILRWEAGESRGGVRAACGVGGWAGVVAWGGAGASGFLEWVFSNNLLRIVSLK